MRLVGRAVPCLLGNTVVRFDLATWSGASSLSRRLLDWYTRRMHDIPQRIVDVLLELEAEMRALDWWEEEKPPANALASQQPFSVDQLAFEQWLQWIFLPRMKDIIETGQSLPAQSGIFAYAEECLRHHGNQSAHLLALLKRFDELVTLDATRKLH